MDSTITKVGSYAGLVATPVAPSASRSLLGGLKDIGVPEQLQNTKSLNQDDNLQTACFRADEPATAMLYELPVSATHELRHAHSPTARKQRRCLALITTLLIAD